MAGSINPSGKKEVSYESNLSSPTAYSALASKVNKVATATVKTSAESLRSTDVSSSALTMRTTAFSPISASYLRTPSTTPISFDITDIDPLTADIAIKTNTSIPRIGPDLIRPTDTPRIEQINKVYKIRKNAEERASFRGNLLSALYESWKASFGEAKANEIQTEFLNLAEHFDENGVGIYSGLVPDEKFEAMIEDYTHILTTEGNKTWLHSYVDLRAHPEFLLNPQYNEAFLHPLNVALIAYKMGGPVRIVDARGKDAEPIAAVTADNMLHIDNVPFVPEIKQTLFWRQGKVLGPNGQCFVCLPGTQQCPRDSDGIIINGMPTPFPIGTEEREKFIEEAAKKAGASSVEEFLKTAVFYTTEGGSVFRTPHELKNAIEAQKEVRGCEKPVVVALRDEHRPLVAMAETGNLVHHRYRRKEGDPRSCLLIAFHLISDDPGQLVTPESLEVARKKVNPSDLHSFLISKHSNKDASLNEEFLKALIPQAKSVASLISHLKGSETSASFHPVFIDPESKKLSDEELLEWQDSVLHGPGTEKIKRDQHILSLKDITSSEEFAYKIKQLMAYDKTGVLELILYSDSREEKRKWVRNQIRELKLETPGTSHLRNPSAPLSMDERFEAWQPRLTQPQAEHFLSKETLASKAIEMTALCRKLIDEKVIPSSGLRQKISPEFVFPAIEQLIGDLGLAIQCAPNRETFLSTGLFLFWSCDTLMRVAPPEMLPKLQEIGDDLLRHYVAASIFIEKQIEKETKVAPDDLTAILD